KGKFLVGLGGRVAHRIGTVRRCDPACDPLVDALRLRGLWQGDHDDGEDQTCKPKHVASPSDSFAGGLCGRQSRHINHLETMAKAGMRATWGNSHGFAR